MFIYLLTNYYCYFIIICIYLFFIDWLIYILSIIIIIIEYISYIAVAALTCSQCILVEYRPVTDLLDDLDINNTLTSKGTFCEVALDKSICRMTSYKRSIIHNLTQ